MIHVCPGCRSVDPDKEIRPEDAPEGRDVADCDCGASFGFPYFPLATLEGAPGVGKSTAAGQMNTDRAVYEGDIHISLTGGDLTWEEVCELDFRVCMTLHAADRPALFVGGMHPYEPADAPEARYFDGFERCALVASDDDLRERLEARGMESDAVSGCLDVNRWYREDSPEAIRCVDTTTLDSETVAERVSARCDSL